jgi:predicted RNA binding protein YcfA (HicA-like mRNA interferase family)
MGKYEKLFFKILSASSDSNIDFDELVNLLVRLGFDFRVKGSHHIFYKTDVDEILNLQSKNGKAKNYQVKQVRELIIKYQLTE